MFCQRGQTLGYFGDQTSESGKTIDVESVDVNPVPNDVSS